MKTIWLLIITQFFSPAEAKWQDYIPDESTVAQARNWILENTDQSVHLFLFQHLPRLFPVPFVCQAKMGAKTQALFPHGPSQTIDAGGVLTCPDLLQLTAREKTTLSLSVENENPVIDLQSGSVEVAPLHGAKFAIQSQENRLTIESAEGNAAILAQATEHGTMVYTDKGILETRFRGTASNHKFYLGTQRGRIGIQSDTLPGKRYFFAFDFFSPLDLMVPKDQVLGLSQRNWESFGFNVSKFGTYLTISLNPASPRGTAELFVQGPGGAHKCQIFTRPSETTALVKAYDFAAKDLPARHTVKLHPDYLKYYLNVACTDEANNTVSSNELPPTVRAK